MALQWRPAGDLDLSEVRGTVGEDYFMYTVFRGAGIGLHSQKIPRLLQTCPSSASGLECC